MGMCSYSFSFHYRFKPAGNTDSEQVFCAILNALNAKFDSFPSLGELHSTIEELCMEIVQKSEATILNFLLGCGEGIQFAYSWPGSRPGSTTWNGLHYKQINHEEDGAQHNCKDSVAIIATKPLTNDNSWIEFSKGDLLLFCKGKVISNHLDLQ
jgi:glutamine amidotransferase